MTDRLQELRDAEERLGDVIAGLALDRYDDVGHSVPDSLVRELEQLLARSLIERGRTLRRSDIRGWWDELRAAIGEEELRQRRNKLGDPRD